MNGKRSDAPAKSRTGHGAATCPTLPNEQSSGPNAKQKTGRVRGQVQGVLDMLSETVGNKVAMNLLEKSGLTGNKVKRDLNLLADAVGEASRYLHDEAGLAAELDAHFGFDRLAAPKQGKPRADGATVAALLWNERSDAPQRIHAGGWLGIKGIRPANRHQMPRQSPRKDSRTRGKRLPDRTFCPLSNRQRWRYKQRVAQGDSAGCAAPCDTSLAKRRRSLKPTQTWAQTTPGRCSTKSWVTRALTERSLRARHRRT